MNRDQLAHAAHEINRAYCAALGDSSQAAWEEAPDWQKASALAGVDMHLANPDATPEQSHESWLAQKTTEGWTFGFVKDAEKKEHPCFMPYEQLPIEQRAKDYLFRAVVHTLKDAPDAVISAAPAAQTAQIMATPDGFLPIRYIGKRQTYIDGAFGTKTEFVQGGTRLVPVDVARKMLAHKDVYELGEAEAGAVGSKPADDDGDEESQQEMRDSIASMSKEGLAVLAKSHFNVDLDKSKKVGDLRTQVTGLVDQFGLV